MPLGAGLVERLAAGRRAVAAWLAALPAPGLWAVTLALVLGVAAFDWLTGFELTFSLFYLAPVGLAAWFGGRATGLLTSVLAAAEGLALDLVGIRDVAAPVHAWDAVIRFGFFAIVTLLLVRLRRAFEQLEDLAQTDPLTGLLNRRALAEVLAREVVRERRTGQGFALLAFDLDGFKEVNDRLGHAQGDAVLQAVARAMTRVAGDADVAARVGGDEFVMIFLEADAEAAFQSAERLQREVRRAMAEGRWTTDLSGGVVAFNVPPGSAAEALEAADVLARRAKAEGKGRLLRAESGAPAQRAGSNIAALTAASSDQKT